MIFSKREIKLLGKPFLVYLLGTGIIALLLLGTLVYQFIALYTVHKKLFRINTGLTRYEQEGVNPPSDEKLKYLQAGLENLGQIYKRLSETPFLRGAKSELKDTDALKFKEKLFAAQEELRQKATEQKIGLPKSLGFDLYEEKLPQLVELADLFNKLELLKEVTNYLLKARIKRLDSISFTEVQEKNYPTPDGLSYKEFSINLTFYSYFPELLNFITSLSYSKYLLKVEDLFLQKEFFGLKEKEGKGIEGITIKLTDDTELLYVKIKIGTVFFIEVEGQL